MSEVIWLTLAAMAMFLVLLVPANYFLGRLMSSRQDDVSETERQVSKTASDDTVSWDIFNAQNIFQMDNIYGLVLQQPKRTAPSIRYLNADVTFLNAVVPRVEELQRKVSEQAQTIAALKAIIERQNAQLRQMKKNQTIDFGWPAQPLGAAQSHGLLHAPY